MIFLGGARTKKQGVVLKKAVSAKSIVAKSAKKQNKKKDPRGQRNPKRLECLAEGRTWKKQTCTGEQRELTPRMAEMVECRKQALDGKTWDAKTHECRASKSSPPSFRGRPRKITEKADRTLTKKRGSKKAKKASKRQRGGW